MKKMLSVVPYRYLPPKNGGHHAVIQTDELFSKIAQLEVATINENDVKHNYNFRIIPAFKNEKSRYIPYKLNGILAPIIKKGNYDFILSHHHYLMPTLYSLCKLYKIPLIIRSHNIESERFKSIGKKWWRLMWYFERWSYNKADKILFISEEDKEYAINNYKIDAKKCFILPFLSPFSAQPDYDFAVMNKTVKQLYKIENEKKIFYFLGDQSYAPNYEAVVYIVDELIPALNSNNIPYHILIVGKGLPSDIHNRIKKSKDNISYLGFVDDLMPILKGSDIMLNPVNKGGGIKTKVIEALSWGKPVVSFASGASGIDPIYTKEKLQIVDDNDTSAFVQSIKIILDNKINQSTTPKSFYDFYSIENNIIKIKEYLAVE